MYRKLALAPGIRGAVRLEFLDAKRDYSLGGCPPKRPPPGVVCPPKCTRPCTPKLKNVEPQIVKPRTDCSKGPIPLNPCCPQFPKGNFKKFRSIFLFFCLPIIVIQGVRALCHDPEPKQVCRDYEYMRRRTKRFPWGDGVKSFFHNDHANSLPGECVDARPGSEECD